MVSNSLLGHGIRLKAAGITFALLLISSSITVIGILPNAPQAKAQLSSLTNSQLAQMFQDTVSTLTLEGNIIDIAAVVDVTNQTTLNLQNKVQQLVSTGVVKPNLLDIIEASRIPLSHSIFFIQNLDEKGANNMLNTTDNVLNAFTNAVEAESGKDIPTSVAEDLINDATKIISDIHKRGREIEPIIQGFNLPLTTQLFDRSDKDLQTLQNISAELKNRGVQFQFEVDPLALVIIVLGLRVVVPAVVGGLATVNAVNQALIQKGFPPLNPVERVGLFLISAGVYGSAGFVLTRDTALLLFRNVGLLLTGGITLPAFATFWLSEGLVKMVLDSINLAPFETNLILTLRGKLVAVVVFFENFDNTLSGWNLFSAFTACCGAPRLDQVTSAFGFPPPSPPFWGKVHAIANGVQCLFNNFVDFQKSFTVSTPGNYKVSATIGAAVCDVCVVDGRVDVDHSPVLEQGGGTIAGGTTSTIAFKSAVINIPSAGSHTIDLRMDTTVMCSGDFASYFDDVKVQSTSSPVTGTPVGGPYFSLQVNQTSVNATKGSTTVVPLKVIWNTGYTAEPVSARFVGNMTSVIPSISSVSNTTSSQLFNVALNVPSGVQTGNYFVAINIIEPDGDSQFISIPVRVQ